MDLNEIMKLDGFVVLGGTLNEEKYAAKILQGLKNQGYTAYGVGKEAKSINDITEEISVIDMCINPVKGLALLKECKKDFKIIVLQPGADSPELINYLDTNNLPYVHSCLLIGLAKYGKGL